MKEIKECMDNDADVPSNILHCFQATTNDFGLFDEEILVSHRINFIFAIKQKNDGKINSHKWFFLGLCKLLQPELCLILDCGTRPNNYAL